MASHWIVFAAALCVLGGGYGAPCDPAVGIVDESPCEADVKPIPLPSPLSFPIPAPPALPTSSIYSLLSQAQNGDPKAVLTQVSKFLASTLPCAHLQAAAMAQPPSGDAPVEVVEVRESPPYNSPGIAPCGIPAPLSVPPCPAYGPIAPGVPLPVAPPCSIPTGVPVPSPAPGGTPIAPGSPAILSPTSPNVVSAPVRNPSAPIVPTPTIQTPVSYAIAPPPPTDVVVPASGLDLLPLGPRANVAVAAPAETLLATLEPVAAPATCAKPVDFEFPEFGQATSRLYQPWTKMYESMRRLYEPHYY